MKNLYVGNLPYSTTDEDLRTLFAQFGEVQSVSVIADRFSGQSKGFGFVMMDAKGGQAAIDQLHQSEIGGRSITVNEARPREESAGRRNVGGGGRRDY